MWERWKRDAFLARYGRQDIFKIRGSDAPLTELDRALFEMALLEHIEMEYQVPADVRAARDEG